MVMSPVKQRYRDISPVTLQVAGGAMSSSLYCGEVEGLSGGLVEAFMVELYRCKLCQFTCGLKAAISNHLLFRHRPPTLTYLGEGDGGAEADDREEDRFDLNRESKQSDEDEDFLLYNMLDNMSPPTCDISSEGGLQVAHTCEVSTLFEEESAMFPLKESSVDLSCPIEPPATQEEMAQSAHLMTLGLCRISAAKPPLPPPSSRPFPPPPGLKQSEPASRQTTTSSSGERRLACFLCAATLSSRRLLDVHTRSHRAAGGFGCICCNWMADSWEELEPHWRSHCRRRRRRKRRKEEQEQEPHCRRIRKDEQEEQEEQEPPCRRRKEEQEPHCRRRRKEEQEEQEPPCRRKRRKEEQEKKRKKAARLFSCPVCRRTFRSIASRDAHQQTGDGCNQHRHGNHSDGRRSKLIGQAGGVEAESTNSQTSQGRTNPLQSVTEGRTEEKDGFFCSLCHRKFSTKLTLRRHLGTHGGGKPFTCPQCPYSSRLKASLLQHLRTHTGEKPYRCAECPYASIDRSSLLRHSRTHSQEKPYSCQHCDYSSIQKKSLDLHARRHHTGEAFPCQKCHYSSPDRQLLLRHIRRHHSCDQTL